MHGNMLSHYVVYVKPLLHGNMLMAAYVKPLLHGNMLMAAYMKLLLHGNMLMEYT